MSHRRSLALAALSAVALAAAPGAARADSRSDAFEGKIPPVSGALYRKAGRVELTVTGDLSLNDAFFNKYFGGLKLGYHFTEAWSLSAHVASGAAVRTGSAVVCPTGAGCSPASDTQLYQVPGKLDLLTGLEVAWSPVYGKLNAFSEKVGHFDLSILLGADRFGFRKVLSKADAEALAPGQKPPGDAAWGGHVGLGARLFLAEWAALRLEVKDYVYQVTVPNLPASGGKDVQNQLFTELGFSVFFPFQNRPLP